MGAPPATWWVGRAGVYGWPSRWVARCGARGRPHRGLTYARSSPWVARSSGPSAADRGLTYARSMAIISWGTYIPESRLDRGLIGAALGTPAGTGTRSVAGYDEDTTSMGVE